MQLACAGQERETQRAGGRKRARARARASERGEGERKRGEERRREREKEGKRKRKRAVRALMGPKRYIAKDQGNDRQGASEPCCSSSVSKGDDPRRAGLHAWARGRASLGANLCRKQGLIDARECMLGTGAQLCLLDGTNIERRIP
jgi:hypothetical protein